MDNFNDTDVFFPDVRRCPRHGCQTSSDDGLFDAPCGFCEGEMSAIGDALDHAAQILADPTSADADRAEAKLVESMGGPEIIAWIRARVAAADAADRVTRAAYVIAGPPDDGIPF